MYQTGYPNPQQQAAIRQQFPGAGPMGMMGAAQQQGIKFVCIPYTVHGVHHSMQKMHGIKFTNLHYYVFIIIILSFSLSISFELPSAEVRVDLGYRRPR